MKYEHRLGRTPEYTPTARRRKPIWGYDINPFEVEDRVPRFYLQTKYNVDSLPVWNQERVLIAKMYRSDDSANNKTCAAVWTPKSMLWRQYSREIKYAKTNILCFSRFLRYIKFYCDWCDYVVYYFCVYALSLYNFVFSPCRYFGILYLIEIKRKNAFSCLVLQYSSTDFDRVPFLRNSTFKLRRPSTNFQHRIAKRTKWRTRSIVSQWVTVPGACIRNEDIKLPLVTGKTENLRRILDPHVATEAFC